MQKQKMMLKSEGILRYLLGTSDKIDTLITCKPNDIELICYDQSVYEAVGSLSLKERTYAFKKIVKLLESVDVISAKYNLKKEREILKEERVSELRSLALPKDNEIGSHDQYNEDVLDMQNISENIEKEFDEEEVR